MYNDATGLFFAISNDSSNLYLNFAVTDSEKMMKIINTGWLVNLLAKNKKGKTKGSQIFQAKKAPVKTEDGGNDGFKDDWHA